MYTNNSIENPYTTFALFAFNQERYIREAVNGALAQRYSPLQIILSDDHSSDQSYAIMQEIVAEYIGPHEILLNRNKSNFGLAEHINHVMSLAKGELIVVAAGDDISVPERTAKTVNFYIENGKPDSIFSYFHQIDEYGEQIDKNFNDKPYEQTIEEFIKSPMIKGASHAWTKRIYDVFGPLSRNVLCEDQTIPFRAYILNRPRFLDEKLIYYRRLQFDVDKFKFFDVSLRRDISSNRQFLIDAKKMNLTGELIDRIEERTFELNLIHEFWLSKKFNSILFAVSMIRYFGVRKSLQWIVRKLHSNFIFHNRKK